MIRKKKRKEKERDSARAYKLLVEFFLIEIPKPNLLVHLL